MEITKDKVTELFCIIDEFYKVFDAENAGKLLLSEDGVKRRRRKASLSDSEIMTILLYFHFGSFRNFKHYYLFFIRVNVLTEAIVNAPISSALKYFLFIR